MSFSFSNGTFSVTDKKNNTVTINKDGQVTLNNITINNIFNNDPLAATIEFNGQQLEADLDGNVNVKFDAFGVTLDLTGHVADGNVSVDKVDVNVTALNTGHVNKLVGVGIDLNLAFTPDSSSFDVIPKVTVGGVDVVDSGGNWLVDFVKDTSIGQLLGGRHDFHQAYLDAALKGEDFPYNSYMEYITQKNAAIEQSVAESFLLIVPPVRNDPLILDLDGDGVETVSVDKGILFDHDADGLKIATGWVASDDALLVRDINGNGLIDSGRELFGDQTAINNDSLISRRSHYPYYRNGFSALSGEIDSNFDGVIDSNDEYFDELKIWQDINQDGISQSSELKKLSEVGVTAIQVGNLNKLDQNQNGNELTFASNYTLNGEIFQLGEVNYAIDTFNSEYSERISITEEAQQLPEIKGSGLVRNLREAMSHSVDLMNAVQAFSLARTEAEQRELLTNVITEWAITSTDIHSDFMFYNGTGSAYGIISMARKSGVSGNANLSEHSRYIHDEDIDLTFKRGGGVSKLVILEAFMGMGANVVRVDHIINSRAIGVDYRGFLWAGELIDKAYQVLEDSIFKSLVVQTRLKPYLDSMTLEFTDEGELFWDSSKLEVMLDNNILADQVAGLIDLVELTKFSGQQLLSFNFNSYLYLESKLNSIEMTEALTLALQEVGLSHATSEKSDLVVGHIGDDSIDGGFGHDGLYGLSGDDVLYGREGNDILIGGIGNDRLYGGEGNDVYIYGAYEGRDTIFNRDAIGIDSLQFKDNVNINDVVFTRQSDSLIIIVNGINHKITVNGYFEAEGNGSGVLDAIVFSDGTSLDYVTVSQKVLQGGSDDDNLNGFSSDDVLTGGAGNDHLYGKGGNDTLDGGFGNDRLSGGTGDDIYLYGMGEGRDTISNNDSEGFDTLRFKENVSFDDVTFLHSGTDLIIKFDGLYREVVVYGYFEGDGSGVGVLDAIIFADGTNLDYSAVVQKVNQGTETNDTLRGFASDDVLIGYAGNDNLYGEAGDDTLTGGIGNDQLYGGAGSDTYLFSVGDGHDIINNEDEGIESVDTLQFDNTLSPNDLTLTQNINDLIISHNNGNDSITVTSFFKDNGDSHYALDIIKFSDGTAWDIIKIKEILGIAPEIEQAIYGDGASNNIRGDIDNNNIFGLGGNDYLYGEDGNDSLNGESGNDYLNGGSGNDILNGGTQNDRLSGGTGSDMYLFNIGDGQDTIYNYDVSEGRYDVLRLGEGITTGEVTLRRDDMHLYIQLNGTSDQIFVSNHFNDSSVRGINAIEFTDGTIWETENIKYQTNQGGNSSDRIYGFDDSDNMSGGAGNDYLSGRAGNDILSGDTGNDTLSGGAGNDTYLFNIGDGQDTIYNYDVSEGRYDVLRLGEGITTGEVTLSRDDMHLYIQLNGTSDQIFVSNHFNDSSVRGINAIEFTDGTIWETENIKYQTNQGGNSSDRIYGFDDNDEMSGGAGNDRLYGRVGDDTLSGDTGNDTLSGGAGNDTYLFNIGDGQDTIHNYDSDINNTDILVLGDGIDLDSLWFNQNNIDLEINIIGTEDKITVANWYSNDLYQLDEVHVNDSTILTSQLEQLVNAMSSYAIEDGEIPLAASNQLQPIWDDILNS